MKARSRFVLATILLIAGAAACGDSGAYLPRDGDIVFQTSHSHRSEIIQRATGSEYSHMGVIFLQDGQPFVFEAHSGVEATSLAEWTARGRDGRYVVKRLRDADRLLTNEALDRMRREGRRLFGRQYDSAFLWSDDRLYCSELVWKIYERGLGLRVGEPRPLRGFNWQDPAVHAELRAQFGDAIPLDELMISPGDMFASRLLVTVKVGRSAFTTSACLTLDRE